MGTNKAWWNLNLPEQLDNNKIIISKLNTSSYVLFIILAVLASIFFIVGIVDNDLTILIFSFFLFIYPFLANPYWSSVYINRDGLGYVFASVFKKFFKWSDINHIEMLPIRGDYLMKLYLKNGNTKILPYSFFISMSHTSVEFAKKLNEYRDSYQH